MNKLHIELGNRSYPIYIGGDLLGCTELYTPYLRGQQVMIVTNEIVAPLYLDRVRNALAAWRCETVVLPDGEEYKTLAVVERILDALLQSRFDRYCTLVALGGGVIGDMVGFAAAIYQRGVNFIQLPTTLLAQVDSSVGGKTGVNHPLGKNMIGAFHQPRLVLADTTTLHTLDDRQLAAGLAEVIKYGIIRDADFYAWLENHLDELLARHPDSLAFAIERSCRNKAEVVIADEFESGERALLNLGHTFGHAMETGMGYGVWLHGEAVAAGMVMAADLSRRLGWIDQSDVERITALLARAHLPCQAPANLSSERCLDLMAMDKKVSAGRIRLVLLKAIGAAMVSADYPATLLQATLEACHSKLHHS
ncbi:3-dehydroquinate synthase [Gammaproteobacteria bacterium]